MLIAFIFIILGLGLLLQAMGIIVGSFWGYFWAIVFIAVGVKILMKNGKCPMCMGSHWQTKMHGRIHEKMGGDCCGGENCCGDENCCEEEGCCKEDKK